MSKRASILGIIGIILLFITIGIYETSIIAAVIVGTLSIVFMIPAIYEGNVICDIEYERQVEDELY